MSTQTRGCSLHPLRPPLLKLASEPASAAEIGAKLGLPRQRVNFTYTRARPGGVPEPPPAGASATCRTALCRDRGGLPARSGGSRAAGADWRSVRDTASAAHLLALSAQMQSDVSPRARRSAGTGRRLPTLSLKSQFRFESAPAAGGLHGALQKAVVEVVRAIPPPISCRTGGPLPDVPTAGHCLLPVRAADAGGGRSGMTRGLRKGAHPDDSRAHPNPRPSRASLAGVGRTR